MPSSDTRDTAPFVVGASVRATIAPPPEQLWAWIADPTRHPRLAGSGEPMSIHLLGAGPVGVGTRFESQQVIAGVVRYPIQSEVVAFEPDRRFRFRVDGGPLWEFELQPVDGGTLVTHRHRFEPPTDGLMGLITPVQRVRARMNTASMVGTLNNLARLAGAPPPEGMQVSYRPPALT